jgi:NRPS condensation-like uncharacterized protein
MSLTLNVSKSETVFPRTLMLERFHYRSPSSNVVMVARLRGTVPAEELEVALRKVRQRHPLLGARIEQGADGTARFVPHGVPELTVRALPRKGDHDWIRLALDEQTIPFALDKGPLIRFLLLQSEGVADMIVLCHHTICDGMSLVYLTRDIMRHLGDPDREVEPLPDLPVVEPANLSRPPASNLVASLMIRVLNWRWNRRKIIFDEDDYREIHRAYWSGATRIVLCGLDEQQTSALATRCRAEGVTVNSALCAALLAAQREAQGTSKPYFKTLPVAADIRARLLRRPGEAVGLYASGVNVRFEYDSTRPFWDNARLLHSQIRRRVESDRELMGMVQFNALEPTLLDASYFVMNGQCHEGTASFLVRLLGFNHKTAGIACSNLGKVAIAGHYGPYVLETMFFLPPLMPNLEKFAGIITAGGRLNITLSYRQEDVDTDTVDRISRSIVAHLNEAVTQ